MKNEPNGEARTTAATGVSRRALLSNSGLMVAGAALAPAVLARRASAAPAATGSRVLVVVFLRGGADLMSVCSPASDPAMATQRPDTAVPLPGAGNNTQPLDGTGTFFLSGAANDLLVPYQNGDLTFVACTGSDDEQTQSHFAAQDHVEGGASVGLVPDGSGWGGRVLAQPSTSTAKLRGMHFGALLAKTLYGGPATLPIPDPSDYQLLGDPGGIALHELALQTIYQQADDPIKTAGLDSLSIINDLATKVAWTGPSVGSYPAGPFGAQMKQAQAMIRANAASNLGIELLTCDFGGWDDHVGIGSAAPGGSFYARAQVLAQGLRAFYDDLQQYGQGGDYTLVVMSEFGRRVTENGNDGVDHGRGNFWIVMGAGGVNGNQVHSLKPDGTSGWAGLLAQSELQVGGSGTINLQVTMNYRDILAEILVQHCGFAPATLPLVFPGYATYTPRGIVF